MFPRRSQNHPYITAPRVSWPDAIRPIGECDNSIGADIDDTFGLCRKAMNMPRLMILRLRNAQNIGETK